MEAKDMTYQMLVYSPRQFIIPVFQRYYSWTSKEWEVLWNDIEDLYTSDDPSRTHFFGSLVFFPLKPTLSGLQTLQVIDGQHRLITLMMHGIAEFRN